MKCPKCGYALEPWPWFDGGYKGVECSNFSCGAKWWSDEIADRLDAALQLAANALVAGSAFPADAVSEEERDAEFKRYAEISRKLREEKP